MPGQAPNVTDQSQPAGLGMSRVSAQSHSALCRTMSTGEPVAVTVIFTSWTDTRRAELLERYSIALPWAYSNV